jgi:F420-dependent oxidoreductase-like protein
MIGITISGPNTLAILDTIKKAEDAGVPAVWMTTAGAGLDALTIFAAAAVQTERVMLGASIIPTWPRHPIVAAQQAQVVAQLAPGRLVLGVGPSNANSMRNLLGVEWRSPARHVREYVMILTSLLHDGAIDFEGEHFTARARIAAPVDVPIMVGTLRKSSYDLAGRYADGAISWLTPWEHLRDENHPAMDAAAKAVNRARPRLVAHVPFVVDEDVGRVHAAVRQQFGFYPGASTYSAMFAEAGFPELGGQWSDELIDAVVVHGSRTHVIDRLQQIAGEGADDIIADPVRTEAMSPDQAIETVAAASKAGARR